MMRKALTREGGRSPPKLLRKAIPGGVPSRPDAGFLRDPPDSGWPGGPPGHHPAWGPGSPGGSSVWAGACAGDVAVMDDGSGQQRRARAEVACPGPTRPALKSVLEGVLDLFSSLLASSPLACSPRPSASVDSLPTARPVVSLTLPLICSVFALDFSFFLSVHSTHVLRVGKNGHIACHRKRVGQTCTGRPPCPDSAQLVCRNESALAWESESKEHVRLMCGGVLGGRMARRWMDMVPLWSPIACPDPFGAGVALEVLWWISVIILVVSVARLHRLPPVGAGPALVPLVERSTRFVMLLRPNYDRTPSAPHWFCPPNFRAFPGS